MHKSTAHGLPVAEGTAVRGGNRAEGFGGGWIDGTVQAPSAPGHQVNAWLQQRGSKSQKLRRSTAMGSTRCLDTMRVAEAQPALPGAHDDELAAVP